MSEEWSVCEQRAAPVEWHFDEKKREGTECGRKSTEEMVLYCQIHGVTDWAQRNTVKSSLVCFCINLDRKRIQKKKKNKKSKPFLQLSEGCVLFSCGSKRQSKVGRFQKSGNNIHRNIREISIQFTNLSIGRLIEESLFFLFWSNW